METAVVPYAFSVGIYLSANVVINRIYNKLGKNELQPHQFFPVLTQLPHVNFIHAGAREVQA